MSNVAEIISQQIGNRAFFMLGTKQRVGDETSLTFNVGRNPKGVTHMTVTLDASDTYTVASFRIRGVKRTDLESRSDVYEADLRRTIEAMTGLRTSL